MSKLIVISAPSGAGKTSLVHAMVERFEHLVASISHTTRTRRPGEVDGEDYHFVDEQTFQAMVTRDAFIEHAEVFGNFYGTSAEQISERRAAGFDVILEIDWQGARNIRNLFDGVISVFVLPPSVEALRQRLIGRAEDDELVIERRMRDAKAEMSHFGEYDFLVVNDDFPSACDQLAAIIERRPGYEANRRDAVIARHPDLIASIDAI